MSCSRGLASIGDRCAARGHATFHGRRAAPSAPHGSRLLTALPAALTSSRRATSTHSSRQRRDRRLLGPRAQQQQQQAPPKVPGTFHAGPQLRYETDSRVVAIADLHGDMQQTIRALRLAGVVPDDASRPEDCYWTGGTTNLVQLGDLLDRGDDEISLLLLLRKLEEEAEEAGGAIHFLNGNHEVLNVNCDFRYVTPGAMRESEEFHARLSESFGSTLALLGDQLPKGVSTPMMEGQGPEYERYMRRVELFAPGGAIAMQLAQHHSVLVINDTLFCHGGLCRDHIDVGLGAMNAAMAAWMRGCLPPELNEALYHAKDNRDSLVWNRTFSMPFRRSFEERLAARELEDVLQGASEEVGAEVRRLVVGHTVQRYGANVALRGQAWRMDVGVSRGVAGAAPEVLEILPGEEPRVLRFPPGQDLPAYDSMTCAINPDTEFEPLACSLFDHRLLLRSEIPI